MLAEIINIAFIRQNASRQIDTPFIDESMNM